MTVKFNKKLTAGLMAAALATASWGALAAVNPTSLSVTFSGSVVDNTCATPTLASGGSTVSIGRISQANFTGVGSVGKTAPFTLNFTGCGSSVTTADIWFDGATTNSIHALDNSTADTNSEGVGIQVWDGTGTTTHLHSDDPTQRLTNVALTASGSSSVTLMAKAVQTGSTKPTIGDVSATGTLYIEYQ